MVLSFYCYYHAHALLSLLVDKFNLYNMIVYCLTAYKVANCDCLCLTMIVVLNYWTVVIIGNVNFDLD